MARNVKPLAFWDAQAMESHPEGQLVESPLNLLEFADLERLFGGFWEHLRSPSSLAAGRNRGVKLLPIKTAVLRQSSYEF